MKTLIPTLTLAVALAASGLAAADGGVPEGWHPSMEDGRKAARTSGKPLLVVTLWSPGL